MPIIVLSALVVILSLVQMALCPPVNQPACAGPTVSVIVFGAMGLAGIGAGIVVHREQKAAKRRGGQQDAR